MKSIIFVLALVAIAAAVPVEKEPTKILRSEFNQEPQGSYSYIFETEDGTNRQETGELREVLDEDKKPRNVVVMKGSYSYINDLGQLDTINYFADENGFHADGESIPKPVQPVSRR